MKVKMQMPKTQPTPLLFSEIPLYFIPKVTGPHKTWRVGRMKKFVIIVMADVNDGGTFLLRLPPAL
jgi:hypothetical protein